MQIVAWRDSTGMLRWSQKYEDVKVAVKYACRKIIEGYDAVVLDEDEFNKILQGWIDAGAISADAV